MVALCCRVMYWYGFTRCNNLAKPGTRNIKKPSDFLLCPMFVTKNGRQNRSMRSCTGFRAKRNKFVLFIFTKMSYVSSSKFK